MLSKTKFSGLDSTTLKIIALVLMLLDHIHYMFEFTGAIPVWFTMAGRLAAPLFLFCAVEGFAHTHDRRRYFLRILLISAGMGLAEFFMMYGGWLNRGDGFFPQNAIFMDFAILCVLWQGVDWLRAKKWLTGILAIGLTVLWPFVAAALSPLPGMARPVGILCYTLLPAWAMVTDGGLPFLVGGVLLYLLRNNRRLQVSVWVVWNVAYQGVFVAVMAMRTVPGFTWSMMFTDYFEWFSTFAAILMLLYNGQRGKGLKQLFYCFYPLHVYILYALSLLVYNMPR